MKLIIITITIILASGRERNSKDHVTLELIFLGQREMSKSAPFHITNIDNSFFKDQQGKLYYSICLYYIKI